MKPPNKQKEITAETFLRMSKDARVMSGTYRRIAKKVGVKSEYERLLTKAEVLEDFAEIHEAEGKKLRAMR